MSRPFGLRLGLLAEKLFDDPKERKTFISALTEPKAMGKSIVWTGNRPSHNPFRPEPALSWQPAFVDRLAPGVEPGKHPLHQTGAYYCLDLSSVFSVVPAKLVGEGHQVVDLCSAPGGKSILCDRLLRPERILCNEVNGKRLGPLKSNLARCGIESAEVCSSDVSDLVEEHGSKFYLALVDAPCSGQSLLARGEAAYSCFNRQTVKHCIKRQRRILKSAAKLVTHTGFIAYMTCTFEPEENEGNLKWFLRSHPCFEAVHVPALSSYQSTLSDQPCYRFWPHRGGLGAGAFTALLRHKVRN